MSHTDLCRGGHNVKKYLDDVESYLNIGEIGYPDAVQSRVVLSIHSFEFPVTAGDKLCFVIYPFPGSPVSIVINDQTSVVKILDRDWGDACNARDVIGKFLSPPDFRCTGVQLRNDREGISDITLKSCKKSSRSGVNLGEYDSTFFGISYKISFIIPEIQTHFSEFGYEIYYGTEYNTGANGIFNFLFDPGETLWFHWRPNLFALVGNTNPLTSCVGSYKRYDPSASLTKCYRVNYECNSTETLYFTMTCRYELFDGVRKLRSPMENAILKHFIDRHKDDPHNFNRQLNFTI